jgi:glutamate-ammonia-ligase adenylyltransferase
MTTALYENSPKLLLEENLSETQIERWLAPVHFADWRTAYRCLQRIAGHGEAAHLALADALAPLLIALANTVSPDKVLVSFERFVQSAADSAELLTYLAQNPRGFEILFTLFTGSQFLTEILLRHPEYFEELTDHKKLAQTKSAGQLHLEAQALVIPFLDEDAPQANPLDELRRFQRRELLRIGTCDLLSLLDLPTITTQLSYLADALTEACLILAAHQTQTDPQNFIVLAMGKLGGEEVNYSSDIDLIFLAGAEANRYIRLGQALINTLTYNTGEGFLYRVDMRLRPWGSSGALVYSVEAHAAYLQKHAGLWERQAMLKARPIAGNLELGYAFLRQVAPFIYQADGAEARAEIHRLKQRIEQQLKQNGRGWGEVKLGQGSIRDIEFVTQYLQLAYSHKLPANADGATNTLKTLANLYAADILPGDEYRMLTDGYIFLRTVEHHLQLMHYRQTHTLPADEQALAHLAHRLGFQSAQAGANFKARYHQHSAVIRAIYQRHLTDEVLLEAERPVHSAPDVLPLLTRMPASYVETFSQAEIEHHAKLIEQLQASQKLIEVDVIPLEGQHWQITLVGYDYLGELSIICGLLFVYGFNIVSGNVFTFGPSLQGDKKAAARQTSLTDSRRKIVDVFTIRQVETNLPSASPQELWQSYSDDLNTLMTRLERGEQRQAQAELAQRVAETLPQIPGVPPNLLPVEIDIDNEGHERHTILRIDALDTIGFLYEFTNALALTGVNVRHMIVASEGNRVQDTLFVTDSQGKKIKSANKQRELRAATVLIKYFTHLLPHAPNPARALLQFREFIGRLFLRPDWPAEIASLEQPDVLHTLARLLGVSQFLWDDFLRMQHANLFPILKDTELLKRKKSKSELHEELASLLRQTPKGDAQKEALNAFKDREMFRIDMRQIQEYITEFGQFSAELTDLAEVVVEAAHDLAAEELRHQFGLARLSNGRPCPLAICALGKCGGRELGFASDIELMFVFAGSGKTSGPRVITNAEYYSKLVQAVSQIIQAKREGVFEVDLRLRPYGKAGNMAVSLDSFERYFGPQGDAWPYERQALVKLRPIGGDLKLGRRVVKLRDRLIYSGQPFDMAAMRAMRERQLRHLVTAGTINAKFSPGGLVDVEYLVQGLQIKHGHLNLNLRQPNTADAMRALAVVTIISEEDYSELRQAHIFLRRLINALRMVRGNAKDLTVPATADEAFAFLARRLKYGDDTARLQADLLRHTTFVQELSQKLLVL